MITGCILGEGHNIQTIGTSQTLFVTSSLQGWTQGPCQDTLELWEGNELPTWSSAGTVLACHLGAGVTLTQIILKHGQTLLLLFLQEVKVQKILKFSGEKAF